MATLDTNVLLRWLLGDVAAQADRAAALIESAAKLQVEDAALIEIVYVLERVMRAPRDTIRDSLLLLISTGSLEFDRALWRRLIDLYVAHSKLSVSDIYFALRAQAAAATPLYTFDRKLATQLDGVEMA